MMVISAQGIVDTNRYIHSTGQQLADQYYHIYNTRLNGVRSSLVKRAQSRWGKEVKNVLLEQLNASLGSEDVFVIGTLFKSMQKQPSILREIEGNDTSINDSDCSQTNYVTDDDTLVLHEIDENVQVVGEIDVDNHVTGIPVALLGHQLNGGAKFHVVDICYAGPILDVYREPSIRNGTSKTKEEYLIIVSGLEFGFDTSLTAEETKKVVANLKKLRDFIHADKSLVKLIIAGNSICPNFTKSKIDLLGSSETKDTHLLDKFVQLFDRYMHDLAQSGLQIILMPGKNDPTSYLLPQQPFHPKILPLSGRLENVHPDTNPCVINHRDLTILGTSGENIEAIKQHSKIEFSTTVLKSTLEWGHVAPSAPDNLSCLPFKDRDPFIIDFVPDIYFAGNQPEYAVTTYACEEKSKIQLVSVPSFVKNLACVSVNLADLECKLIEFTDE